MIELAQSLQGELAELAQKVRAESRRTRTYASETIQIQGESIEARGQWRLGRGENPRAEVRFYLNGHRLGFNALMGELRKRGLE